LMLIFVPKGLYGLTALGRPKTELKTELNPELKAGN
jgi:hypothetical protein